MRKLVAPLCFAGLLAAANAPAMDRDRAAPTRAAERDVARTLSYVVKVVPQ